MAITIDGTDLVLGRLASAVAKKLLQGESIAVINAEKIVVSGDPKVTVEKYQKRRWMQNKANPEESPHWSRKPEMLVKRIIRGMLPFKAARGRDAFKRLRVYSGVPAGIEGKPQKLLDERAGKEKLERKSLTIQKLCQMLGYGS